MGGKGVSKRMERYALADSGRIGRLMEQAVELAGCHRLTRPLTWKQPALLYGSCGIETPPARLPPLAQQVERVGRQHDIAVLAALGLLDPNDLLSAVDVLDLQPDHLAGAQAAAIAETEQHAHPEAARDREQAPGLVLAHHQRNLLRLTEVIHLRRKIQSPQRHAKQEPQPGHDAVAIADARARLGNMQLKPADILRRGRVRGPLEKRSKPLAAVNMAPLRPRAELACVHVLDHALAQRADRNRTHGQLLSWMRLTTPPSSRQADRPATDDLSLVTAPSGKPPLQRAIAQRFSALARLGHAPMSDLSPLSGEERKLDFGAVRSVDDPDSDIGVT